MSDYSSDFDTQPTTQVDYSQDFQAQPTTSTAVTSTSALQPSGLSWYEKALQGIKDPMNAAAQLIVHSPPMRAISLINQAVFSLGGTHHNALSDTYGGLTQSVDDSVKQQEQEYQKKNTDKGIDWWRMGGNIVSPVNALIPGGPEVSGAAKLGVNIAKGAAGAALSTPVTDMNNDFWKQKGKQAATGAIAAGAMTPIASGISRVISPKTSEDVGTLIKSGVTPTPGQILGGSASRIEDAATSIPIIGDAIKSGQRRAIEQFNTAAYQRALDPIGEKAPSVIGNEGVEQVANTLSDRYNKLLPKMNFVPDGQFTQDLAGLQHLASQLPEQQSKQFMNIAKSQLSKAGPGGQMDGQTLKGVMSELLNQSKGYASDPSFDNRQLGHALGEFKDSISRNLQRSNPDQASELNAIDTGWANYARIRQAAASQGSSNGVFTPAQLQAAVRGGDKSVGKGDFAKGNALMQDLSSAGKNVLSQKVPDSGTPLRTLATLGIGAGLAKSVPFIATHPVTALGAVGAGAGAMGAYSSAGQKAIAALLTKRPDLAPQFADMINNRLPALAAPATSNLLRDFSSP